MATSTPGLVQCRVKGVTVAIGPEAQFVVGAVLCQFCPSVKGSCDLYSLVSKFEYEQVSKYEVRFPILSLGVMLCGKR